VTLYALVWSDAVFAIDLFSTHAAAESALQAAVNDKPAFVDLLSIVEIAEPESSIRAG
jgi:hypothetical protein